MGRLILTRRVNERVRIGPDVWVSVVRIDHKQVGLMIEAPKDIAIVREELIREEPCEKKSA